MKNSARAATAIGIGYMLGRHRRFRSAAVMAAAMTVGGTPIGGKLLRQGLKMAGPANLAGKLSPQLGDIAGIMRDDLVTAGKAAATTAVTSRVDLLADSIHERAERVRNPVAALTDDDEEGSGAAGAASKVTGHAGKTATRAARGGRIADEDDSQSGQDAEEPYEDTDERDQDTDEPRGESAEDEKTVSVERTGARRRSPVTRAQGSGAQSSRARGSQERGSQARGSRPQAGSRTGRTGR